MHVVWAGVGSCRQSKGQTLYPIDGSLQLAAHQDGVAAGCRSSCGCCSGRRGCRSRCRVCRTRRWGPASESVVSGLMAAFIASLPGTPHQRCVSCSLYIKDAVPGCSARQQGRRTACTANCQVSAAGACIRSQKAWGSAYPSAGVAASGGAEAAAAGAELVAATACT